MLTSQDDIIELIEADEWMMQILHTAKILALPDWWICAGFIRAKVWDTLHQFTKRTPLPDIDVIYFDPTATDERQEKIYEKQLHKLHKGVPWSVKNEARMHRLHQFPPYTSSVDAISKFPETATAIGVKLDAENNLILAAPHGVTDLLQLHLKPTPFFSSTTERLDIYRSRLSKKNWQLTWNNITVSPDI
ncbi:nucleotidyltransferase family protein [Virgibacillus soli]|uniref:nucleotidyltransferase family protein n=1 Tax=Paracerasibacillus soli TaxID=480284 RepID=UPI0035E972BB